MSSAIFQAGSLLVLVAETRTRSYLASLVPIIVNAVLNEHQLVLDIVAFVALGDFPRSRLGEKQRGKVLGNWVGKRMKPIAQFHIRDPEAEGSINTIVPEESLVGRSSVETSRTTTGSLRRGGPSSSLRHTGSLTSMPVAEELEGEQWHQPPELPTHPEGSDSRSDLTPTNERPRIYTELDYSPAEAPSFDSPERADDQRYNDYQYRDADTPDSPDSAEDYSQYADGRRESGMNLPYMHDIIDSYAGPRPLRIANRTNSNESDHWEQEAMHSLNIRR